MSTAVATYPSQMSFPWMQGEVVRKPSKRSSATKQASRKQVQPGSQKSPESDRPDSFGTAALGTAALGTAALGTAAQVVAPSIAATSQSSVVAPLTGSKVAQVNRPQVAVTRVQALQPTAAIASPKITLADNQRVGEVKIGSVMMQLLKKYGITDEEISSVLATIAQENCEKLAS
jgi:hypothetical protein